MKQLTEYDDKMGKVDTSDFILLSLMICILHDICVIFMAYRSVYDGV